MRGAPRMGARLQPLALRLLALTVPLVAKGFSDETLEKAAKSEGYCSRILRAQGTRREGYNEFSLRVEGDPEFYKPGNSYRGKLAVLSFPQQRCGQDKCPQNCSGALRAPHLPVPAGARVAVWVKAG